MKKIFAVITVIIAVITIMIVQAEEAFLTSDDTGYAVPTSAGIFQLLSSGSDEKVDLVKVDYEDIIYQTISGYYIGEDREAIDITYPMYINGGAVLRFFNEENWLVTAKVTLQQTYDGLYLSDGDAYNKGMQGTDDNEEFILLVLDNGLYMNAQSAVFTTRMDEHDIPANSILYFDESVLRWYYYDGADLKYGEEEKVFDATLTIGDNVYDYVSLLDALGLIREATELQSKGEDSSDVEENAYQKLEDGKTTVKKDTDSKSNDFDVVEGLSDLTGEDSYDNSSSSQNAPNSSGQAGLSGANDDMSDDEQDSDDGKGDNENEELGDTDDEHFSEEEEDVDEEADVSAETSTEAGEDSSSGSDSSSSGSSGGSSGSSGSGSSSSSGSGSSGGAGTGTGGSESDLEAEDGTEGEGEDEQSDELIVPEDVETDSESESGTGTTGNGAQYVYTIPTVKFGNLDVWSYAAGAKLHIFDPSAVIVDGVTIIVYSAVEDTAGDPTETYVDPYTGVEYVAYNEIIDGKTAIVSKTYRSDAEFALGELPIDSDVYIRYRYSYYLEEEKTTEILDEDGNPTGEYETTTTRTREYVVSDLICIQTLGIEDVDIVNADWTENFAASSYGISLSDMTITNSTDYDADLEDFDFENYKLNSAEFISTMRFTVTDEFGVSQTLAVPYSTLANAKLNGVSYNSSSPALASNSVYTYTAQGYDKKYNEFPMQISIDGGLTYTDESEFVGTFYTQKQTPTATISTVENVADKLTIQITISDPDGAIDPNNDTLVLQAKSTQGEITALYGYGDISDNESTDLNATVPFGSDSTYSLSLDNAKDGASYTLRIESLDFAKYYTLSLVGDYDPTPDKAPEGQSLDLVEDSSFASSLVYTKALSYGSISFTSSLSEYDTYVTSQMTMNSSSTTDLVYLVDEFIFDITDMSTGEVVETYTLLASELNNGIELSSVNGEDIITYQLDEEKTGNLNIYFEGTSTQFYGKDLWEAFCITYDAESETYSSPVTMHVDVDPNTLDTATQYQLSITSNVVKSGATTAVTTYLSRSTFWTKKLAPEINIDDIFLASEFLNILDLNIYDPDGTILQDGQVQVLLYYGSICLYSDYIYAVDNDYETIDIEIDGLIEGEEYEFSLVATSYKDAVDSTETLNNVTLYSKTVVAGGNLNGGVSLTSVDYSSNVEKIKTLITVSGEEAMTAIENSTGKTTSDWYAHTETTYPQPSTYFTEVYSLEEMGVSYDDIAYFYIPDYHPDYDTDNPYAYSSGTLVMYPYMQVRLYKDDGYGGYTYVGNQYTYLVGGRIPMIYAPKTSSYTGTNEITGVQFVFPDTYTQEAAAEAGVPEEYQTSYMEKYGFTVYYIDEDDDVEEVDLLAGLNGSSNGVEGANGGTFYSNQVPDSTTGIMGSNTTYGTLHMIPVTPGDWYVRNTSYTISSLPSGTSNSDAASTIRFYNADGAYIGYHTEACHNSLLIVPEDAAYMSVCQYTGTGNTSWGSVVQIFEGPTNAEKDYYGATVSTYVNYEGASSRVPDEITFTLEYSDSMEIPIYTYMREISFGLTKNEDQTDAEEGLELWSLQLTEEEEADLQELFTELTANDGFRITVSTVYSTGSDEKDITLDYITFRTDMVYRTIKSSGDLKVMSAHRFLNYLVTEDFTFTLKNYDTTLAGVLDAQGHVITADDSESLRAFICHNYGTVQNIVYDIPAGTLSNSYGSFNYNNYGTIDNIIIRTLGDITITNYLSPLLSVTNQRGGTISNFIIELGGNTTIAQTTSSYAAVGVRYSYGILESGYMYTKNAGTGVLLYPGEDNNVTYSAGLVGNNETDGIIRNVYTDYDMWIADESVSTMGSAWINRQVATATDMYHVGEFYEYVAGYGATYSNLDTYRLMAYRASFDYSSNLWYVSDNSYGRNILSGSDTQFADQTGIAQLYDVEWQESILGNSFDVAESIEMGFYPRLNTLPLSMQKYQEYRYLPIVDLESTPIPLSDSMVTYNREQDDTTARIQINFQNENRVTLTKVNIDNLIVNEIVSQSRNDEGIYEVVLDVSVDPDNPQYLSDYVVESVVYSLSNKTSSADIDYTMTNVSMWKGIETVEDWTAINYNMSGNYFLKNDIDFTGEVVANIVIRGSSGSTLKTYTNTDSACYFKGGIDGNGYSLKNISMLNTTAPWVIAHLYGGEIFDLTVDNMTITATANAVSGYSGFIRYSSSRPNVIDDVHIINSTVSGVGSMGMLIGYSSSSETLIQNCSVTECVLNDISSSYTTNAGGMVGNFYADSMFNCFTRNVDINITNSSIVGAIGGLVGTGTYPSIYDCYTHGTITATGNYVGGIIGKSGETFNCWSYVDMDIDGNYVGGIEGYIDDRQHNALSVGDIISTGANTHRIAGLSSWTTNQYAWYSNTSAYAGQIVSGVDYGEVDDALQLVTTDDMLTYGTWTDVIKLGDSWDYSTFTKDIIADETGTDETETDETETDETETDETETGAEFDSSKAYFPLLYSTKKDSDGNYILVENQKYIEIPGQFAEPLMTITSANFDDTIDAAYYPYEINIKIEYPGLEASDLEALLVNSDGSTNQNAITIDGMNMSTSSIVNIQSSGEEDVVQFTIKTQQYTLALDSYRLTIKYDVNGVTKDLVSTIYYTYKNGGAAYVPYNTISSLQDWNSYMSEEAHRTSGENYKITGMVDFTSDGSTGTTSYSELKLGRLEGDGSENAGFYNLNYFAGTSGGAWIDSVTNVISNLKFVNITGNFGSVSTSRSRTGMILYANGLDNVVFSGINLTACNNSSSYFSFISYVQGDISNITVSTELSDTINEITNEEDGLEYAIYLDLSVVTGNYSYIGGVAAYQIGGIQNLDASDIMIYSSNKGNYVGGILGSQSNSASYTNTNITLDNINVYAYTGGATLCGWCLGVTSVDSETGISVKVTNSYVNSQLSAGGVAGVASGTQNGIIVDNVTVTGFYTGNTTGEFYKGGIFGVTNSGTYTIGDCTVMNSVVEGTAQLGGILGRNTNYYIRDCQVIDTDITALSVSGKTYTYAYAGGLVGRDTGSTRLIDNVVLRNVNIEGYAQTGGIVGYKSSNATYIERAYIAEDVTVKSQTSVAGGMVGQSEYTTINSSAVGADVTSTTSYAGGMIGLASADNVAYVNIANSYYRGTVVASDYAAGVVGFINNSSCYETISGMVVDADVISYGSNISPTVNHIKSENGANKIYVHEDTTINGVQISSAIQMTGVSESTYIATNSSLVDSDWFKDADNYTAAGYSTSYWDFSHMSDTDNEFMPYVKSDTYSTILPYSNSITDSETGVTTDVGILLPEAGATVDDLVVYASGVNTINIEVKLDDDEDYKEITIKSTDGNKIEIYNAYEVYGNSAVSSSYSGYGVITIEYDYETDFVVTDGSNTCYAYADDLARTVMSYGSYWYYINDAEDEYEGDIVFGGSGTVYIMEDPTDENPTIIHMYQGKALTDDGTVYSLSNVMTKDDDDGFDEWDVLEETKPFFTTSASNGYAVLNYYNFTLYNNALISDNRLYIQGTNSYLIAVDQNSAYDGVAFAYHSSSKLVYFGMLIDDEFVDQTKAMNLSTLSTTDISHISNNLGYTDTVIAIRYDNGSVAVVNYYSGTILSSTISLEQYIENAIDSAMAGVMSMFTGEESTEYQIVVQQSNQSSEESNDDEIIDGTSYADGTAKNDNAVQSLNEELEDEVIKGTSEIDGYDNGLEGTSEADGENDDESSANIQGQISVEGEGEVIEGIGEITFNSGVTAIILSNDDDTDDSDDSDDSSSDSSNTSSEDEVSTQIDSPMVNSALVLTDVEYPSTAIYDIENNTLSTELGTIAIQNSTYVSNEGIYVEGELIYAEITATGEESDTRYVYMESLETQRANTLDTLGEFVIAYNPETGKYEEIATASLFDNNKTNSSNQNIEELVEDLSINDNSDFAINQGLSKTLTQTEKSGFALLAFVGLAGTILLVVIYFRIRKRN